MSYPDFKTMEDKLQRRPNLWIEYTEESHDCCKEIYENPSNEELIVKNGKIIYDKGGITALQANFYVIIFNWKNRDFALILDKIFEKVTSEWKI